MKKVVISLSFLFLLFTLIKNEAYSENKKIKVAIMDLTANNISKETASSIADLLRTELINTNAVSVIERTSIEKIIKEQKFQALGMVDTSQAVELGKILAADKMIMGSVSRFSFGIIINTRVVDVESGEIEVADKTLSESEDYLMETCEKLAGKLASKITGEEVMVSGRRYMARVSDFSENKVIAAYSTQTWESDTVLISMGREDDIIKGNLLTVYTRDRLSGEENVKGKIEVKDIYEGYSKCRLKGGGGCFLPFEFGKSKPIIVVGDEVRLDND